MKNQEQYTSLNMLQPFFGKQLLSMSLIKCVQEKQAYQFCFRQKCNQKISFTCSNPKCKCNIGHKGCQKANIQMVLDTIKHKLQDKQKLKDYVDQVIDKIIQRISVLREKITNQLDKTLKYFPLNSIQTQFYKLFLKQSKIQQITSKKLSQLWISINQEKKLESIFNQKIKQLDSFSVSINQIISSLQQKIEIKKKQVLRNSSIIVQCQDLQKLVKFFQKKVHLSVLFKASEHGFSIKKYYQMCGHQKDTIIIFLNQNNKIIGGQTPLHFNADLKPQKALCC